MMDNFSYSRPATLRDAANQLGKEHGKIALIAGGTDLLGEMKDNLASPERLVSIRHLAELQGVRASGTGLRIGAATLLADIIENPMVQERTPLLAMGATARISAGSRERTVPMEKFFVTPRENVLRENVLLPNEILTAIDVPAAPAGATAIYIKEMVREVWDFALCSVAAMVTVKDGVVADARIVLGGVAPIPYRAVKAEATLIGKPLNDANATAAGVAAVDGARPLAKDAYKVPLTQAVVKRALLSLA